jgi:hypothetical protein
MDDGRICAVVKGKKGVRKIHALNNCRSLQPNIAIVIAAADSRSNRGSDGVLAFQQKAKEASGCSSMLEWLLAPTKAAVSHDAQNRFHDFPNTLRAKMFTKNSTLRPLRNLLRRIARCPS